ncbi:hypothetical protein JDV02_005485 [Purpureocillium takamizusanense]|uniref:Uncharacterized protein n=1 Tax=Purpureocillium takamizusanense TaxID=2060973 RepID=A0A9Q8VB37_9HYPO|nr:uncharacterized protein JDV02_005485 [Purpureocillium takamizusanense]UNI19293.1 hypothetical protein JDV02_005485 [Purpureocillium takamizusanense]
MCFQTIEFAGCKNDNCTIAWYVRPYRPTTCDVVREKFPHVAETGIGFCGRGVHVTRRVIKSDYYCANCQATEGRKEARRKRKEEKQRKEAEG